MNMLEGTGRVSLPLWLIPKMNKRTLHQEITNKQDRNGSVVLDAFEVQILFESVQSGLGQGISIEVVEEVHGPENGLVLSAIEYELFSRDVP